MSWRLVCDSCACLLRDEFKSIGILIHPDVHCASCGERIRENEDDHRHAGWHAVTDDQLAKILKLRGV